MQASTIDDVLIATILLGLLLSVASMVVSVLNGRTSQRAQIKATLNLRELYDRTYRKTPFKGLRFVSVPRPGKTDRRVAPARSVAPESPDSPAPPKAPE